MSRYHCNGQFSRKVMFQQPLHWVQSHISIPLAHMRTGILTPLGRGFPSRDGAGGGGGVAQVGAKVVLGDRPVRVTLARSWAALGRWERVRFVWTLLRSGCFVPNEALRESVESMKVRSLSGPSGKAHVSSMGQ